MEYGVDVELVARLQELAIVCPAGQGAAAVELYQGRNRLTLVLQAGHVPLAARLLDHLLPAGRLVLPGENCASAATQCPGRRDC